MSRNRSLDLLKLILAALVVAIHTHFLRDFNIWAYRFTAEGFFRIAVPLFLLVNGYFFFTAVQEHRLAAWFRHVLSLYAIWMLIYLPLWAFPAGEPLHFSALLRTLVVGWHHLWYLAAMISGGALLALLAHRLSTRLLLMVACTLFVVGVLIQYAGNYHWFAYSAGLDKWTNVVWVYRNGVFTALPMMGIGYLIARERAADRIAEPYLTIAIVSGALLLAVEIGFYGMRGGDEGFDMMFSILLLAPALFVWCVRRRSVGDGKTIALYATGIYFIHPWIIYALEHRFEMNTILLTGIVLLLAAAAARLMMAARRVGLPLF